MEAKIEKDLGVGIKHQEVYMFYEEVARLLSLMFDPVPFFVLIEDPATNTATIRLPAKAREIVLGAIQVHCLS